MSTRLVPITALLLSVVIALPARAALDAEFLLGDQEMPRPVATQAFVPAASGATASRFEGVLSFKPANNRNRMKVVRDWFAYAGNESLDIARMPAMEFGIVQEGGLLLPLDRTPKAGNHPHWELALGPGRAWHDPADRGWTRAALPFALLERNANCTHNGLMTFLFHQDGRVSRIAYQVGSETCQYFQADLWGTLDAHYEPGALEGSQQALSGYHAEQSARLPARALSALESDYPGTRAGAFDWYPDEEVTTLGFVIDGVHYSGGCGTRHGPYPFCAELVLPSYSLAKSLFGGLAWMMLEQERPGIGRALVSEHVPECRNETWKGVTLQHLLDMATGNYNNLEPNADEFALYETPFMAGETHAEKAAVACGLFPRRAWPGSTFAYHTSDTYLAGVVMSELIARDGGPGSDLHRDLLRDRLFEPLGLSALTRFTRRTYDDRAQPFTGYGLYLHPDDLARIGRFLAAGDGRVGGKPVVDPYLLRSALQRNPNDPGRAAGGEDLRYNNGFWAYRTDLGGACPEVIWIPFLSGYGGISMAVLPNNSVFYVFSDMGRFEWLRAAIESNRARSFCD